MLDPRGLIFPALLMIFVALAMVYVSWWSMLLPIGYFLGYVDPYSANGKRRTFR